jgi:hypothetical protein
MSDIISCTEQFVVIVVVVDDRIVVFERISRTFSGKTTITTNADESEKCQRDPKKEKYV